jgi:hypothetical protein
VCNLNSQQCYAASGAVTSGESVLLDAAVVARKQRLPSDEAGGVAAADAVAPGVAAIVITARRVTLPA